MHRYTTLFVKMVHTIHSSRLNEGYEKSNLQGQTFQLRLANLMKPDDCLKCDVYALMKLTDGIDYTYTHVSQFVTHPLIIITWQYLYL